MNIVVFDRNFNRLCMFDTDERDFTKFSLLNDNQTYTITDGVMLSTFTASFSKNHDYAQHLQLGNYLAFKDEWDKTWCFTINDITSETNTTREIYCEDLGLDLLNSVSLTFEANRDQPISYYLERELSDTGWEIGINEISTKRKVTFDNSSTTLKRIQDLATAYDCEIYFDIEFNGNSLIKQNVNVVKRIGLQTPKVRLTTNKEITNIKKQINIKELKTAVYATGANNSDIASLSYNDGKYSSMYGSNLIVDLNANERWNRFPNRHWSERGYLEMVNVSESSEPNQILADGIKALKEYTEPKATYEAEFLFGVGENIALGDVVQLVDLSFNPKLLLESRITSFEISRLNPTQNKVTISNTKEVDDGISQVIKDFNYVNNRVDKTEQESIKITIKQEAMGNQRKLIAQVYRGNVNITSQFTDAEFVWTKTNIDGIHDLSWEQEHRNVGPTLIENLDDVDRTALYECSVIYHQFQLVSSQWFQSGLKTISAKLIAEKGEDDIAVIFATDLHYALSTVIRKNSQPLHFSKEHIRNIVELTKMAPIDLIVLGGDNADGSSPKFQQEKALKEVVSTLQLSDSPFVLAKGNHDDNSWYAQVKLGPYWDLSEVVTDEEYYDIAAKPSSRFDGLDVQDSYYSYDTGEVRHIILNAHDIPYKLNSNGNPKYSGQYTVAYRQKQVDWFIEKLSTAPKYICIYQHPQFKGTYDNGNSNEMSCYNDDVILGILDAYQNRKSYKSIKDDEDFKLNVNVDFTNATGTICFGMFGHYHNDRITNKSSINFVSTGCCAPVERKVRGEGLLADRELNTLKEDLFDIVIIKPSERKVKMLRFGAGVDREITF